MGISEKAVEFIALNKRKKSLMDELAELEAGIEQAEKDLYWSFAAEKMEELTVAGYVLKPVQKFFASAKDEKTIRVMRRRGYGELVKATIHPSTVHAFIRKQTEQNNGNLPRWITDNFRIVNKESVSMRRE